MVQILHMAQILCDLGVASRVIADGKILLVQEAHGRHQGRWGFPKGHVEANESPEAAALRAVSYTHLTLPTILRV